ncbi:alpha/beta fold hydrolase [Pseudomonas marginalis]|uniref:alpha/beta fold hydrolase n=1 Tax=Pseudomonas marginalis TaxID=298 RepID=UPI00248175ED|nr:alpha/beta fold hydrolase [Pseudomonas marginalis]WGT27239.1 alpha/beta fold hydrolase [Pseudomonas marginalis]WGT27279.1 alpha/beta fold hydrolase [Pseudomonas marginalis]
MNVAKYLACGCFCLTANLGQAEPLIKPTAIDWLLDCPLPAAERLDPEVLSRTQCGIVTVPRNYAAPRQGSIRLYLTRVGAREPLNRAGLVFAQAGNASRSNTGGTFAIQLASRWGDYSTQAYRRLLNYYDVIEVSPRDLKHDKSVEQAARDMEFVRAQLGDAQLLYLGNADASRLGNRYGTLYPERVARMVLVNAPYGEKAAPLVEQLHLKEAAQTGTSGCVNQWVGDFLAYGRQPPPSTRCLDSGNWE